MLVLSRRESESLVIGDDVTVRVLSIKGSRVRLGIDAPESVAIKRNELVIDLDGASVHHQASHHYKTPCSRNFASNRDDQCIKSMTA